MTRDKDLYIVILTSDVLRAQRVLAAVADMERFNGTIKVSEGRGRLYAKDAVYQVISPNSMSCMGTSADQVILDFVEPNFKVARELLQRSCVPDSDQIIDDRDVLNGFSSGLLYTIDEYMGGSLNV